jgi:hypothetical protein
MSKLFLFLVVFFSLTSGRTIYAEEVRFASARFTSIEHRSFEKIRLTFDVRPRQPISTKDFETYLTSASVYFGLDGQNDPVITSARLEWGGLAPIFLAESAFIDLHLPTHVNVAQKGGNLLVSVSGGDAGSGYIAVIEVAPYGVVSRRVHNRISGFEQLTSYSYPPSVIESRIYELKKIREARESTIAQPPALTLTK